MKTKDLLHDVIFTMSILYLGILGRHQIWMLCQNGVTGWLLSTCKEHKPRKGQGGSGQIKEKVSNLSGLTQYFTRHSLTPYHLHSKTRQRLTGNKIVSTGKSFWRCNKALKVTAVRWEEPSALLSDCRDHSIWLAPPQVSWSELLHSANHTLML